MGGFEKIKEIRNKTSLSQGFGIKMKKKEKI